MGFLWAAFQNVLTSGAGALVGTVTNSGMSMISGATSVNDNNAAYDVFRTANLHPML